MLFWDILKSKLKIIKIIVFIIFCRELLARAHTLGHGCCKHGISDWKRKRRDAPHCKLETETLIFADKNWKTNGNCATSLALAPRFEECFQNKHLTLVCWVIKLRTHQPIMPSVLGWIGLTKPSNQLTKALKPCQGAESFNNVKISVAFTKFAPI